MASARVGVVEVDRVVYQSAVKRAGKRPALRQLGQSGETATGRTRSGSHRIFFARPKLRPFPDSCFFL